MSERSEFVNALIGAAVTVVLAFLPFSSVLGGGVAGYLQGGDVGAGLRVGAFAGLLAAVPVLIVFAFIGTVFSVGLMGMGGGRMLAVGGAFVVTAVLFSLVYVVGLSAVGGLVGAAVRGDPDLDPQAEG